MTTEVGSEIISRGPDSVVLPHIIIPYVQSETRWLMVYIQLLTGPLRQVETFVNSTGNLLTLSFLWSNILLCPGMMHNRFKDATGSNIYGPDSVITESFKNEIKKVKGESSSAIKKHHMHVNLSFVVQKQPCAPNDLRKPVEYLEYASRGGGQATRFICIHLVEEEDNFQRYHDNSSPTFSTYAPSPPPRAARATMPSFSTHTFTVPTTYAKVGRSFDPHVERESMVRECHGLLLCLHRLRCQ